MAINPGSTAAASRSITAVGSSPRGGRSAPRSRVTSSADAVAGTLRVGTEKLLIDEPAKDKITDLGVKVSLRYALQLLAPASVLAKVGGRQGGEIGVAEVEECEGLFLDAGRSAKGLGGGDYIS